MCLGLSAYWLKEVLDYHQSPQGRLAERLLSRDRTMLGLVFALAAMLLIVGCTGAQPTSEPTKGIFAASTGSSPGDSDGGFTITSDGDSSGGFTITSDGDSDANVEQEEVEDTGSETEVIEETVEEQEERKRKLRQSEAENVDVDIGI